MRHQVDGRQFGRNTSHRVAMLKNLANAVIQKERVMTTVPKAKEVRRVVDRLITLAKKNTLAARRLVFSRTRDTVVVQKLFTELLSRYQERKGGYTRVVKLSERRWGDAAEMALLELVDHPPIVRGKQAAKQKKAAASPGGESSGQAQESTPSEAESVMPASTQDPFKRYRKQFLPKKTSHPQ